MRKLIANWLAGTALAAAASLGAAVSANAGVVTFDGHTAPGTFVNDYEESGLHFFGGQSYFVPVGSVSRPIAYRSPFMETALEPLVITLPGGGSFELNSVMLGLGEFNTTPDFDTVTVVGRKAVGCLVGCSVTADLRVGYRFTTFALQGFTDLASVSFDQHNDAGYLAFDNIAFNGGVPPGVPEPATWGLMIVGFGCVGAMLRVTRRKAALA